MGERSAAGAVNEPLHVPVEGLRAGRFALSLRASRYVGIVRRRAVGAALVLVDHYARLEAEALVVEVNDGSVVVTASEPRASLRLAPREITIVQALAKGEKMDAIVRDATELGATRIVPALAARSVTKLEGARATERLARWRRIAVEAARQCGRGDVPEVDPVTSLIDALREVEARWRLVLAPSGGAFAEALGAEGSVALAIGPEGGFSSEEMAEAGSLDWRSAQLGAFVMRTETAAAAALGALAALSPVRV